ncbi:MAG: N-acetylmuramidase [Actinobacteria bacterium]|jgi:lysozyme family protein|nr:N-acetylmuramidase [Actinomycetota bacterium]
MADFNAAFQKVLHDEGGFKLTDIPGDRGGMTYAGIARNANPDWPGWNLVDHKEFGEVLTEMVRKFYKSSFWDRIRGDDLTNQSVAENIFNFGVNTGVGVAVKLAQLIVGAAPDGAIGPATVQKLNTVDPESFRKAYALAKIARYADICNKNRTQSKFLLGWINRTLSGLK